MLTNSCKKDDNKNNPTSGSTVTDIDGNIYHTVTIGTQVWMVENLKTTKYRNGDLIPKITDDIAWSNQTEAYCNYNNDANNSTTYGRLYNWYAVNDSRNIAPTGWHVSSDVEWTTLTTYLGGESVAGGKLKETGTTHWSIFNPAVTTNESGFTALPGGSRGTFGQFYDVGHGGVWWSSTESETRYAWYRSMADISYSIGRGPCAKNLGYSVRCVRD